ncbi:glycosyl transferase [Jannaschia sp. Os4]|uniref:DUF5927 domain-containing protein n=1 Tax=Jannaschia sp. Os4 TaxID=2807617 RepID=UPI00193A292E|nr:beta-1,6-N-acetylglucosaminyltransferase [Jannaschia sp. Os4]MBM2575619.1 glycosyl transferase [Jannaschia sp. Os4]
MSLGILMMVHTAFGRAAQVARHFAERGCPVVIHVDRRVRAKVVKGFRQSLYGAGDVHFTPRVRVEWGAWSMVEATQIAAEEMLARHPEVRHVMLASGSCLPLRPVSELIDYLDAHPDTDFIESVTTEQVTWTIDGLEEERFTLRFPFSWRRHRRLFDGYVRLQRRIGFERRVPAGIEPHLGSQWWCLTADTLRAILEDPDRPAHDAYFRHVWIPDESYFQTLARGRSHRIDSRSLTLSKFDVGGKPHVFYDDHLHLLRRSDCFMARKIWPGADLLYETFLSPSAERTKRTEPDPGKIDRVFARANARRAHGRPGLYNQGRFPHWGWEGRRTAARYTVLSGFDDLFEDFPAWFAKRAGGRVHGHLYHPDRVEFAGGERLVRGNLTDDARLRDHRPEQFLFNLLWSTRGERQTFLFGPGDRQRVADMMMGDPDATFGMVTGAWIVPLLRSGRPFPEVQAEAARLQRAEMRLIEMSKARWARARVLSWSLAELVTAPMDRLQALLDEVAPRDRAQPTEAPVMHGLDGLPDLLRRLRDNGVKPVVMGDLRQIERGPTATMPTLRPAAG